MGDWLGYDDYDAHAGAADVVTGGPGPDVLTGNGGNDNLRGNGGRDRADGGEATTMPAQDGDNDACIAEEEENGES